MLEYQVELADEAVFDEKRLGKADSGIEVEVGHRHRVLQHIPEHLLSVKQVEVSAPGQRRLRQLLGDGNLKLDVGVGLVGGLVDRRPEDEIIVLVKPEVIMLVGKGALEGVGVDVLLRGDIDNLRGHTPGQHHRHDNGNQEQGRSAQSCGSLSHIYNIGESIGKQQRHHGGGCYGLQN